MANHNSKNVAPHGSGDSVVYRVMAAVVVACAAIFVLMHVKSAYSLAGSMMRVYRGLLVGAWVGAALTVVCAVAAFLLRRKVGWRYVVGFVGAVSALSLVCCVLLRIYWVSAATGCYFLWIAAALLYSLYLLYQHELFVIATLTTIAGVTFYLLSHSASTLAICAMIVLIALSVLVAVLTFIATHHNGQLTLFGHTFQLFSVGFAALPLYLACVLWPLCAIAALLVGSTFAYYCIYAAVGGALIAVCYYTIKLM
jgi:hypothetical protein